MIISLGNPEISMIQLMKVKIMSYEKTCWTCKHRGLDITIKPCVDCDDLLHDFHEYTNWDEQKND